MEKAGYLMGFSSPPSRSLEWFANIVLNYLFGNLLPRLYELVSAPFYSPNMLWIVIPLVISVILMQAYFGRHSEEELGWNTAFGNNIALMFVCLNLLQQLYNKFNFGVFSPFMVNSSELWLVYAVASISLLQVLLNFFHWIPKTLSFFLSGSLPINLIAYISIVLVYTSVPINFVTATASITLFLILLLLFKLFRALIPKSKDAKKFLSEQKEKMLEIVMKAHTIMVRREKINFVNKLDSYNLVAPALLVVAGIALFELFVVTRFLWTWWFVQIIGGAALLGISALFIWKRKLFLSNLGFKFRISSIIKAACFCFFMLALASFLNYYYFLYLPASAKNAFSDSAAFYASAFGNYGALILLVIGNIILFPIGIELFFRGLLQRNFKLSHKVTTAVLFQSLLFPVVYLNVWQIKGLFGSYFLFSYPLLVTFGFLLGYLREKAGLEASMFCHVFFNLFGVLYALLG